MPQFQIGDNIIMNDLADTLYGFTRTGSTGVVVGEYHHGEYEVQFDFCSGYPGCQEKFSVAEQAMSLVDQKSIEERVNRKVKIMWERQSFMKEKVNV